MELIRRLAAVTVAAEKTRCHGDFHLGQVLVVQADLMIVDFEGEPVRGLEERRAKSTPLRDVAGMVRSLDYAAAAAVLQLAASRPQDLEELTRHALVWRNLATNAFLDCYIATAEGCSSFPTDRDVALQLLDLLVLEKALYEICYEAANRPTWLGIPVRGVTALLDARRPAGGGGGP